MHNVDTFIYQIGNYIGIHNDPSQDAMRLKFKEYFDWLKYPSSKTCVLVSN